MYKLVELSKLCNIQIGKTPDRKTEKYWGKGYPWVTISDLKEKTVSKTKEQITKEAVEEKNCRLVKKSTLLMSFKLSIGKLAFTDCDLYTNEAIAALNIKEDAELDKEYLYYVLKFVPLLNDAKIAVKGKTLNQKTLAKIKIPLPNTIDEQKKIANLLSQIENLIQKREKSIELLDKLVKSTFLDMFGQVLADKKPTNLMSFNKFVTIDTNMVDDFELYGDLPHIGVASIEKKTGKILEYKLAKDDNIISGKYLFDKRHILYSKIRPNLNKVAIPDFKGLLSADAYPLLANEEYINKYFLAYLLKSKFFLGYILSFSIRANIPKVNKKQLSGFKCNIPPKDLQDKFANIVTKIETTKKTYQKSLDELKQLFGSVSQRAFKGELDLNIVTLEFEDKYPDILDEIIKEEERKNTHFEKAYEKYTTPFISKTKDGEAHGHQMDAEGFKNLIKEILQNAHTFEELQSKIQSKGWVIPYDEKLNKKEKPFTYKESIFELLKEGEIVQSFQKNRKKIVLKAQK